MSAVIMSPALEIIQPAKKIEKDNESDQNTDEPISQESIKTQNSQNSQVSQKSEDSQESWTNISRMIAGKVDQVFCRHPRLSPTSGNFQLL